MREQRQSVFTLAMNCDPEPPLRIRGEAPLLARGRAGLVWRLGLLGIVASVSLAGCGREGAVSRPPVWFEEGIAHGDFVISLGYRGEKPQPGGIIEPVAMITRGGQPAADAMVFVGLGRGGAGEMGLADIATVYEPPARGVPGVYAQAKLPVPGGATECPVRFRIVLGESEQDWTREVQIPLK